MGPVTDAMHLRTDMSSWDGAFSATCVHGNPVIWDAHIRSSWTCTCEPDQGEPVDLKTIAEQAWHVGRSFGGPSLFEQECPCDKAPCGLAILGSAKTCPQHSIMAGKTIRSSHSAADCSSTAWSQDTLDAAG